jgi:hypothetical protein
MSQSFTTDSGTNLVVPGAYAKLDVQNNASGLATSGILILVGEADAGPRFDSETKLRLNVFGPTQKSDVVAKYKSGPLVDAFNGAIAASNDSQIQGSFTGCILVKTNASVQATSLLTKIGTGNYGTLTIVQGGQTGNLFFRKVIDTNQTEIVPSTGPIVMASIPTTTHAEIRVNGGTVHTLSLTVGQLPSDVLSAINALGAGVTATGALNRGVISAATKIAGGQLAISNVSGKSCLLTLSVVSVWAVNPTIGDTLIIPSDSALVTAANHGSYVVCSVTNNTIGLYKVANLTAGTVTAPTAESAVTIGAITDAEAFSPLVISVNAGSSSPGLGQSLEIADTTPGTFSDSVFTFTSATSATPAVAADWTSTATSGWAIPSSREYGVTLNVSRQVDNINQDIEVDGKVILTLGAVATTASAVIANNVMTITVTGGGSLPPSTALDFSQFITINDLVAQLKALGFLAAAATATVGQLSPTVLDAGTYTLATSNGALTGRIKDDGYTFAQAVAASGFVALVPSYPLTALVGLPDISSTAAFSGGARGATTNTDIQAALDALKAVRGNFVIPLFSNDAAVDIADGLTDVSSTYDVASIAAQVKSHVLFISQLKQRRPRQGLLSFRGAYVDAKEFAGNVAQARCSTFFQDIRDINSTGSIVQFRPWMAAVKAAGMQVAGFYKGIVNKFVNISGALQAAGDWSDDLDDNVADALQAGLCPIVADETGGWTWSSDQTTYGVDNNWIFNSIQAMYVCDIVQTTSMTRMNRAFVGQSVADISASIASMAFGTILDDFKRLHLLAASDDAPKGWRNMIVKIQGPALICSVEIKVAGLIYFVPISFLVTPVIQSATG